MINYMNSTSRYCRILKFASLSRLRCLSTTPSRFLKRIDESTTGKTIEVRGQYLESKNKVFEAHNPHDACPLCRLNLKLKFSDVLILKQFLRPDGTVLPREVTGLCAEQQESVENLVLQAHWSGLFPTHKPADYNPDFEESEYRRYKRYWNTSEELLEQKLVTKPGSWYYVRRY